MANEMERVVARMKSYTGPAVLVFFLYLLFWFPGLVVNIIYYREAKKMEKLASHTLPGVGCLSIMLWLNILALIGGILILLFLCGALSR